MTHSPALRIAAFMSHPIQYFTPLWQELSTRPGISLRVHYFSRQGLEHSLDAGFGRSFAWDIDLRAGHDHRFLPRRWPTRDPLDHTPRALNADHPELSPWAVRIDQAIAAREKRARAVRAATARVHASFDADDFESAIRYAVEALQIDSTQPDLQELKDNAIARLSEKRRREEEERTAREQKALELQAREVLAREEERRREESKRRMDEVERTLATLAAEQGVSVSDFIRETFDKKTDERGTS